MSDEYDWAKDDKAIHEKLKREGKLNTYWTKAEREDGARFLKCNGYFKCGREEHARILATVEALHEELKVAHGVIDLLTGGDNTVNGMRRQSLLAALGEK